MGAAPDARTSSAISESGISLNACSKARSADASAARRRRFTAASQAAFAGLRIEVPALYLVGEYDTGLEIPGMRQIIDAMPLLVPDLRGSQVIARAGHWHWLKQETPGAVNAALAAFLRAL